jgi:hypothetical protein
VSAPQVRPRGTVRRGEHSAEYGGVLGRSDHLIGVDVSARGVDVSARPGRQEGLHLGGIEPSARVDASALAAARSRSAAVRGRAFGGCHHTQFTLAGGRGRRRQMGIRGGHGSVGVIEEAVNWRLAHRDGLQPLGGGSIVGDQRVEFAPGLKLALDRVHGMSAGAPTATVLMGRGGGAGGVGLVM